MTTCGRYSITTGQNKCALCGADVLALLLGNGVLTAPVEVFDHTLEVAPTLMRPVCGCCAQEVADTHAALVAGLIELEPLADVQSHDAAHPS